MATKPTSPPAPTLEQRVRNSPLLTTLLALSPARLQELDDDLKLVVRETASRSEESEVPLTGEVSLAIKFTTNPEAEQVDFTVGAKVKIPDRAAHPGRLNLGHNGAVSALERREDRKSGDNVVPLK